MPFSDPGDLILTAEVTPTSPTPQENTETIAPAPTITGTPDKPIIFTPTPAPAEATQYHLKVEMDYETHILNVDQRVVYTNRSNIAINHLIFITQANLNPGIFLLKDLFWEGDQAIEDYSLESDILKIPLRDSLRPGQKVNLSITYSLKIPEQSGTLGYTSRQINLADWYPFLPVFTSENGWLVHPPHKVGEYLVYDIADYHVEIQPINFPANVVIAASAPSQKVGDHLTYDAKNARNITFSISAEFKKVTSDAGGVILTAYVFPEHEQAGKVSLTYMAEAMNLFTDQFYPYSRSSLTLVEWQSPDGMEYDGLFFLNWNYFEYAPGGASSGLASMVVHETAHQWWYALVGNDPAEDAWLDEALSTYSEKLFYEMVYPDLVAWWWEYRILRYKPEGAVNQSIYEFKAYRPYINATYLRGAFFLDDLRKSIGDIAFFALLKQYALRYKNGLASAEGFFNLVAEVSPINITELVNRYFIQVP